MVILGQGGWSPRKPRPFGTLQEPDQTIRYGVVSTAKSKPRSWRIELGPFFRYLMEKVENNFAWIGS